MTDPDVLRAHVTALASQPRHRARAGSRERAQAYVGAVLQESGWQVTHSDFRSTPSLLRTSDYGRRWWPAGAGGPISGRNVIAHRGNPEGATWVMAHLDSVHSSPGADDNASAVAIALELGRQSDRDDVAIVLTDHEESAMLGARMLVRDGQDRGSSSTWSRSATSETNRDPSARYLTSTSPTPSSRPQSKPLGPGATSSSSLTDRTPPGRPPLFSRS